MDPRTLLDEKDRTVLEALSFLERNHNKSNDIVVISKAVNSTPRQLVALLKGVNADLREIFPTDNIYVAEVKKSVWEVHNFSKLTLEQISLAFLRRSSMFMVFEYLVFYTDILSPHQYVQKRHVSRAVFYRRLKQAERLVRHFLVEDIAEKPGSEFQNRLLLFQLYYSAFKGYGEPLPELDPLINAVIDVCEPFFSHALRTSQRAKLSIFLRIWIMPQRNKKINSLESIQVDENNQQYPKLFAGLKQALSRNFQLSDSEMNYLYGFLLAKQYVEPTSDAEITNNFPLAAAVSDDLINLIRDFQIMDHFDPSVERRLRHDFTEVNLQLTSFYIEPMTFIRESSSKFFGKTYPSFDITIVRFMMQMDRRYNISLSPEDWVNVYYGYMFALINNVSKEEIKERVYVAIDFSQGDLYTQYVINSLDAFHHANIIVGSTVTKDTDIYVSDVYSSNVHLPQLIWEDPPTPEDWDDLGTLIEIARSGKAVQLFK
jgi:hypothetical protein